MMEALLGLEVRLAVQRLEEEGARVEVVQYASARPYEDADSSRVVRAAKRGDGIVELVACQFKTKV